MHSSTLTSKGQVTIPRDIRQTLGLHPGDTVGFIKQGDQIILIRKYRKIEAAFGLCRPKRSASLKEIETAIRKRGSHQDEDR